MESIMKKTISRELENEIAFTKKDLEKLEEMYEQENVESRVAIKLREERKIHRAPIKIESPRSSMTVSQDFHPRGNHEEPKFEQELLDSSLEDKYDDEARANVPKF